MLEILYCTVALPVVLLFTYGYKKAEDRDIAKCEEILEELGNLMVCSEQLDRYLEDLKRLVFLPNTYSEEIYKKVLFRLETEPGWLGIKGFAVNIGRWHYERSSKDKKLSEQDELRIQTDILARTK